MNTIRTNLSSLLAQRVNASQKAGVAGSLRKLSTGQQINLGGDSPAGLISSENLKAVLAALEAESRVIQRVDSVAAVADGALAETSDLLIEAKGLAVANANGAGLSDGERAANQLQIDSIFSSVDRISRTTRFNGDPLLDGTASLAAAGQTLDIDSAATGQIGGVVVNGNPQTLSDVASGGPLDTATGNVGGAVQAIDAAINQVSTLRGKIGAFQKNTIASSLRSTGVAIENTAAANSQIRDTDFASETSRLIRSQILDVSSLTMLGLANRQAADVLTLLG